VKEVSLSLLYLARPGVKAGIMKKLIIILLFFSATPDVVAQPSDLHLLKLRMESTSNDTLRVLMLDSLSLEFSEIDPDSSLLYADQEIALSRKLNFRLNEAYAMNNKAYALLNMGNYPAALKVLLSAFQIAEDKASEKKIIPVKYRNFGGINLSDETPETYRLQILGWLHFNTGVLYENANNKEKELMHYSRSRQLAEQTKNLSLIGVANMNLGRLYLLLKNLDSALICETKAYENSTQLGVLEYNGSVLLNLGRIYLARGEKEKAIEFIQRAIAASEKQKYLRGVIAANLLMADIKMKENKIDSGYHYATAALKIAIQLGLPDLLLRSYIAMADFYKKMNNNDSIVKYQSLVIKIKDSLFNAKQARQFQNIDFDETQRQQELAEAKKDYKNRLQKYMLIAGLAVVLFAVIILWRNIVDKQRSYRQLKKQKEETDFQKMKVEQTLEELKITQAQLVQSEKMASLGELTAGIAHEIQNPLNFINNFSEVNAELFDELEQEVNKGNLDEVKAIAKDIKENEGKINHHGKRADAIVKNMLYHTRSSSGKKEPTDINTLADEYLRLAYHGFRAKDKSFNATMKTDFDKSIGNMNIIPQDIGRVVLNLINNAFYVVDEKKKLSFAKVSEDKYEPTVSVSTKKIGDKVLISVKDNGSGIPQKVLEKIFQPFFTTKPTGQGTGLGLSLSYDIIKAHGGELKVETKEGEGAEFVVNLPHP